MHSNDFVPFFTPIASLQSLQSENDQLDLEWVQRRELLINQNEMATLLRLLRVAREVVTNPGNPDSLCGLAEEIESLAELESELLDSVEFF
ncbi:hypothetical protein [Chromobacterium sp. Panama]|uniref:hypothetical protein n=1 Tax=Chromobacterium sp. Panama TaxID=2161826 RepID=UPI0011B26E9C|nr:hypothetical protein [Chromobacterium sp. Panama]